MSSIVSNLIEKTLSQSNSQVFAKTYRGVEEEIIAKINNYRLKISHVKDKLEELIKLCANPEDCTITIKELNKVIHYGSQENIDKLMNYLNYLSELKHTIPDFFHTPYLNAVFTRNFSSVIDSQKGLLQKSNESNEKLKKLLPSRNYHGIKIPNIDFKDIDLVLCFIVLEEFFLLSSNNELLRNDNIVIEANNEGMPQDISIFNPSFNTLMVYAAEREQNLYLLFLTDVLELMGPDNAEFPFISRVDLHDPVKKSRFTRTMPRLDGGSDERQDIKGGKKYENLKSSLPDMSLDQVQRFVLLLDNDNDFRINIQNILDVVKKNKLVWEDSVVNDMFEEIFQRRNVVVETQRRNPVDAHEIFHAMRYKYKKDNEAGRWIPSTRPYRDHWLTIFKLVGIELPKYTLPDLRPKPLLCNFEEGAMSSRTDKWDQNQENKVTIKDRKPEILKKQYKPEANILIQNTQNIQELYIDDREHAKHEDSNKNAFQTLINAKFKDLTQKTEYQTVEFSTQGYYKEALRLSKEPELYIQEKVNPIFKYVPVKKDYVYQQHQQELESIRDTRSAFQNDEIELDDSIEPNPGSKRVTLFSIRGPQMSKSNKSIRLVQTPTNMDEIKMLGSHTRATTLSSSMKQRTSSPKNSKSKRPIFLTSFKSQDNETIRMQIAKLEPILDSYNPPKNHVFRSDSAPENKPPFMFTWQNDIPEFTKTPENKDTKDALEQELYERMMYERMMKGNHMNDKQWTRYFKLAPRERGFVDHKYPEFLQKGSYVDGNVKGAPFVRGEVETAVPFKLFHRSLRKTDKNQSFGEDLPTKM